MIVEKIIIMYINFGYSILSVPEGKAIKLIFLYSF